MTSSSVSREGALPGAPAPAAWTVWPLAERGWPRWLAIFLLVGIVIVATITTGRLLLGLGASAVMGLALWRFFVPVRYEIDASGVAEQAFRRRSHLAWKDVRRHEILRDGVVLSTNRERGPWDFWRDLFVPFGGAREEVLAWVEYRLERRGVNVPLGDAAASAGHGSSPSEGETAP